MPIHFIPDAAGLPIRVKMTGAPGLRSIAQIVTEQKVQN
jgi:hypothetical protein